MWTKMALASPQLFLPEQLLHQSLPPLFRRKNLGHGPKSILSKLCRRDALISLLLVTGLDYCYRHQHQHQHQ
jgi:hypothetical protein